MEWCGAAVVGNETWQKKLTYMQVEKTFLGMDSHALALALALTLVLALVTALALALVSNVQ